VAQLRLDALDPRGGVRGRLDARTPAHAVVVRHLALGPQRPAHRLLALPLGLRDEPERLSSNSS
jgi:hypothetical protein